MAVTGQIGQEAVVLENAATEETLRLLLKATLATSKAQKDAISQMVIKAGLDPNIIRLTNSELRQLGSESESSGEKLNTFGKGVAILGGAFGGLQNATSTISKAFNNVSDFTEKLTSGSGKISELLNSFSSLPFGIGLVASGFSRLAKYQEDMLTSYQLMSSAGVNFGGDLNKIRLSAANSYMTMDSFAKLMRDNSTAFARMGGIVNNGAEAFARMSNSLLKSDAGRYLMDLGYSADQVNQGMATYLAISGPRTAQEMKNTKAMTESSAAYMEQLDGLARLTGKNREQQEEELKRASLNAAWQAKLASMSEEERKKAILGFSQAMQTGGIGAAEAWQAGIMKVAPTKAAAQFTGLFPQAAAAQRQAIDMVANNNKTEKDLRDQGFSIIKAQNEDLKKYGEQTLFAIINQGGQYADTLQTVATNQLALGNLTKEEYDRALAKKDLDKAQVEQAVKLQRATQEAAQSILSQLLPVVEKLTPKLVSMLEGFNNFLQYLKDFPETFDQIKTAAMALVAGFVALKVAQGVKAAVGLFGGGAGEGVTDVIRGTLGGGAAAESGAGVGAAIGGVATGLRALANPASLGGLAAVTVAIIGLAKAAEIATPAFEPFGKMIKVVFEGLGVIVKNIGEAASNVFIGLSVSMAKLSQSADPMKLLKLAGSFTALSPALGLMAVTGAPGGLAIGVLANNMAKLSNLDPDKLDRIAASIQKIKDATPGIGASISAGISGLVSRTFGTTETPATETINPLPNEFDDLKTEMQTMNKHMMQVMGSLREIVDFSKKNVDATKSLNRNLFPG